MRKLVKIKILIMLFKLCILLLPSFPTCLCKQTITIDEFNGVISLFDNGTVKDYLESPFCDNKQKISLSSYDFRIKTKCRDSNTKCKFQTMPLSTEAALLLHAGCSFKNECGNLDFAKVAKNQNNDSLHSLLIDYHCLGTMDRLFEICEDRVEIVTGTMHLVSGKTTRQYFKCKCSLKGENNSVVAVKIKDIRLYSTGKLPRECSKSVLKVDENTFACNPTTSTFGSIFNKALPMNAHNESISVSLDVKGHDHEMVWLTFETQGSMSVECSGRLTETAMVATASNKKYGQVPHSDIQSDDLSMDSTKDQEDATLIAVPVIFSTGILCAALCIIIYAYRTIQRRENQASLPAVKSTRTIKSSVVVEIKPSDLNHDIRPETTYFTIGQCEETVEKEKNVKNTSIKRRLVYWFQSFFQRKQFQSPLRSQPTEVVEETLDIECPTPKGVDKRSAGSFIESGVSMLSDENLKSDCYRREITGISVQESGQDEGDDPAEENHHTYTPLCRSLSNDSGGGIKESEIYHHTQFKKVSQQRDPTYHHVPADRRWATNNYPRS